MKILFLITIFLLSLNSFAGGATSEGGPPIEINSISTPIDVGDIKMICGDK